MLLTMNFTAPAAPPSAQKYMPENTESFADGLWSIFRNAIGDLNPNLTDAAQICLCIIALSLLISLLNSFKGISKGAVQLTGTIGVGVILLQPAQTMIHLGIETIETMSEYGKLLLPVMTAALAAQGGTTSSAALYTGTAVFDAVLMTVIQRIFVPLIYIFLALSIGIAVTRQDILKNFHSFIKWGLTWILKLVLYVFTGYISLTGVITGTVDATAVKAAKITISGAVPVVGSILSDASETILVSAGLVKNSAGVYGLLVILSIWIGPFIRIAIQYLLLKLTAAVCGTFGNHPSTELVQNFTTAMGFLLAATGVMCLLLLISTVCFMRGVTV